MTTRTRWVLGIAAAVIVLWAFAAYSPVLVSRFISQDSAAKYGTIGDMFGAASSLFAAIGFLGLIGVLLWDIEERHRDLKDRREARRPYIAPVISENGVDVQDAGWNGVTFQVGIAVTLKLENATEEPALNMQITSCIHTLPGAPSKVETASTSDTSGAPVWPKDGQEVTVSYVTSGGVAESLLSELAEGRKLLIPFEVAYQSLNGTKWISRVSYEVRCDRAPDKSILSTVLDRSQQERIRGDGVGDANRVLMTPRAVNDSWEQVPG
ncbi:hypothetical protein [Janibacter melonis]|uniref:hypothetical protein n=1 Tax=Janibacter melonis TaxID=262209 RepID=UPI0017490552|nr:hypothetical protein [Janibacter melonis]